MASLVFCSLLLYHLVEVVNGDTMTSLQEKEMSKMKEEIWSNNT